MENLFPAEIALDIFSRLPAESVLRCRLVCKTWRTLLNDTNFADIHLRRQLLQLDDAPKFHNHLDVVAGAKVGFIFLIEIDDEGQLVYGEYDENDEQSYKTLTRINHPPIEAIIHDWVDSCNGLFCLSVDHNGFQDPVYICNPITRECTNLPKFMDFKVGKSRFDYDDYLRDKNGIMVSGFGCNLSMNEYKVVRIYYADYRYRDNRVGCVQVYTLGGGGSGWRSKGEISYKFLDRQGVFINGALHWLEGTGKIVAFDLADEKFRVLPAPPFLDDKMVLVSQLHVLGGCLCIFHYIEASESIHIWSFKKKKTSCYDDSSNKEEYYKSWSWSYEFSMNIDMGYRLVYEHCPSALMKKGRVLLSLGFSNQISSLARYDRKTGTVEKLMDCFEEGSFCRKTIHMNSFVSLKSLGEDAKIIGSVEMGGGEE